MEQADGTIDQPIHDRDLLTLLDILQSSELDEIQQEAVEALRAASQVLNLDHISNVEKNGSVIAKEFDKASHLGGNVGNQGERKKGALAVFFRSFVSCIRSTLWPPCRLSIICRSNN
jgi:hypothetical protein